MTNYIDTYILKQAGCKLDWFTAPTSNYPTCKTVTQIRVFDKIMSQLQSGS